MKRRLALMLVFCMLMSMLPTAFAEGPMQNAGNEVEDLEMSADTGDIVMDESPSLDLGDFELVQQELEGSEQAGDEAVPVSGEEGVSVTPEENEESGNATTQAFPKTLKLGVKQTFALNVSKITKSKKVTFKSSKTSVAAVSKKGVVTAKKKGSAKISVIVNKKTVATCKVTVLAAPKKVTLPAVSIDLGVKETFQIVPKLPSKTMASFTYSTKNKKIATVSKTGLVKGVKAGKSTTITVTTHNKKKVTLTVNVKKAPSKVTVPKKLAIGKGETLQLSATLPNKSASALTWSTNKKKVATVSKTGLVKGVKVGTAKITVKTFNKKSAVCTVTVKNAPGKVTLDATKATITAGETLQLKAKLPNKTASALTWTSSAKGVATVNENGLVTAVAPGKAKITVKTFNKKAATCTVIVNAAQTPTEAPTEIPTEAPTEIPTEAPTEAPTAAPTEAPTAAPTEAPTAAPTEAPTAVPTEAPTPTPTAKPAIKTAAAEKAEIVVQPGQIATLKVVVTCEGEPTLTYKWYKGDAMIDGATGDSYTTEAIEANTTFKCVVSDGDNSKDVTFTVSLDNELTAEAKDGKTEFTVPMGGTAILEVTAKCAVGKVKYQWYQGDTALEGQTKKKLTTEAIEANASFKCVISDAYGTKPVEVAFTVAASENTVKMDAPVINLRKSAIKTGEELVVNIGNYQSNADYNVQLFKGSKALSDWDYDHNGSQYKIHFNRSLAAGEYTVRVSVSADNYESNQAEATFTVAEDAELPTPVFELNKTEFERWDDVEVTVTDLPEVDSGILNYDLQVCDANGNAIWSNNYNVDCSEESASMAFNTGDLPGGTYTYTVRLTVSSKGYKGSSAEKTFTVNEGDAAKSLPNPTYDTIQAVHPGETLVIKGLRLDIEAGDETEYPYTNYEVVLTDPEGRTTRSSDGHRPDEAFDFQIEIPGNWATGESKLTITATNDGYLPGVLKDVPVEIEAYGPVELTFSYNEETITDAFEVPYGSFELTFGKTVEDDVELSLSVEDKDGKSVWSDDYWFNALEESRQINLEVDPGEYTLKANAVGEHYTEKSYEFTLTVKPIGTLSAPEFQLTYPEDKDQVPVNSGNITVKLTNQGEYDPSLDDLYFRLTLADADGKLVKSSSDWYEEEDDRIFYINIDGLPAGKYTLNMETSAVGYDKATGTGIEITLVKAEETLQAPAFTLNPADTGSVNKRDGLTVVFTNADEQPEAANVSYQYTAVKAGGSEGDRQIGYLDQNDDVYSIETYWWENGTYTVTITATAQGYDNVSAEPFEMTLVPAEILAAPEYELSSDPGEVKNYEDLVVTIKNPKYGYDYSVQFGAFYRNDAGEQIFSDYSGAQQDPKNGARFIVRKDNLKNYTGKYVLRIAVSSTGCDDGEAFVNIELIPKPMSEQVEATLALGKTTSGKFTESDREAIFSFIPPRTGRYTLASEKEGFYANLYDANEKNVASDSYYDRALSFTQLLTGGKTYYYRLNYSPDGGIEDEANIDFSIKAGDVALKLGEGVQNSFDEDDCAWFSFTPEETVTYTFSAGISDGWMQLLDGNGKGIISCDIDGDDSRLVRQLTKGKAYFYEVYNYGSGESVTATLTKGALQAAADGDTEITAYMGDRVTLKVNASNGEGKVDYEWVCDGNWISNSNAATFTTEPINREVTTVTCWVRDANDYDNSISVTFTITADDYEENDLWIERKGVEYVTIKPDGSKTLQVDAGCNDGVMTLQWYYRNKSLDDEGYMVNGDWVAISGATDKALKLAGDNAHTTTYRCVVSDTHRNTAEVTFGVDASAALSLEKDYDQTRTNVKNGENATLAVSIEAADPNPTVQWYLEDEEEGSYVRIPDATGKVYKPVVTKNASYRCVVVDRLFNMLFANFSVTVPRGWDVESTGTTQLDVKSGADVMLSAEVTVDEGVTPPTYSWQKYDSDKEEYVTLSTGTQTGTVSTTIEGVTASASYRFYVEDGSGNGDYITYSITVVDDSQAENIPASGGSLAVSVGSEDKWYSFKPAETGTYRFYSSSSEGEPDPKCTVYDADLGQIGGGDDDVGMDFDFTVELTKDEQYYFKLHNYEPGDPDFTVTIEMVEE